MNRNLNEIIGSNDEMLRSISDSWKNVLRVACPGIIQSFNSKEQTVTVQPAIREQILKEDLNKEWLELPLLLDVPIIIPRAGNYSLTMPINKGDECLLIFLDSCMDSWWTYGNIQNQIEKRRHDLSDAVAIMGLWSQPNLIPNYSIDSCQLRNNQGTAFIELKDNSINIVADSVNINGINFNTHVHSYANGDTSSPK